MSKCFRYFLLIRIFFLSFLFSCIFFFMLLDFLADICDCIIVVTFISLLGCVTLILGICNFIGFIIYLSLSVLSSLHDSVGLNFSLLCDIFLDFINLLLDGLDNSLFTSFLCILDNLLSKYLLFVSIVGNFIDSLVNLGLCLPKLILNGFSELTLDLFDNLI